MDPEKYIDKSPHGERSFSSGDEYYDENLNEPAPEESLHRGLKARQISMIAVGISQPFQRPRLNVDLSSLVELLERV